MEALRGRLVVTATPPPGAAAMPTARSLAMPLALYEWRAVRLSGSAERTVPLTLERRKALLPCCLFVVFVDWGGGGARGVSGGSRGGERAAGERRRRAAAEAKHVGARQPGLLAGRSTSQPAFGTDVRRQRLERRAEDGERPRATKGGRWLQQPLSSAAAPLLRSPERGRALLGPAVIRDPVDRRDPSTTRHALSDESAVLERGGGRGASGRASFFCRRLIRAPAP